MEKTYEIAGYVKRIAITGPESSGKTSLGLELAKYYQAPLVEEFAREYLTQLDHPYTVEDLEFIAHRQLSLELKSWEQKSDLVFFDTDLLVLKIWYEHKFGYVPQWIKETFKEDRYDFHLLLRPDIPYENDPLRENPDKGEYFFSLFKEELTNLDWPHIVIEGAYPERFTKAKKAIDSMIHGL
jgi:nicotinamide riboside kinase